MTRNRIPLLALAAMLAVFAVACGSGPGGNSDDTGLIPRITASDRIFTEADFLSVYLKKSNDYDVAGLTGVTSAIYGFWKPDGTVSVECEVRFHPSHEVAVSDGIFFADEVTGPGAAVTEDAVTWNEGTRDRRTSGINGAAAVEALP